ncbi:MAG: glycosyltransferase family 2 protein, partial [bacterium]|nr:glycosyltransferase family 2 protein [bacterium]
MISVVVPIFNEEAIVAELLRRLDAALQACGEPYEIVLVNDGSRDGTSGVVRSLFPLYPAVVLVELSRNFGHQLAATAGLDRARGDAVVLMDGDLQDPPELITELLARWREGYDVVYAVRRTRRGESRFKLWTASLFYRMTARLTNVSIPVDVGDFRLMSRRVVDAVQQLRE